MTATRQPRLQVYSTGFIVRDVPGHTWIRAFVSFTGKCQPGHRWLYNGLVRRDAWVIRGVGFGLIRMPRRHSTPTTKSA